MWYMWEREEERIDLEQRLGCNQKIKSIERGRRRVVVVIHMIPTYF